MEQKKFSASEFATKKASEMRERFAEKEETPAEPQEPSIETPEEELPVVPDEVLPVEMATEEPLAEEEPPAVEPQTPKEKALLKEIARLKEDRREARTNLGEVVPTVQEDEQAEVTKAEARLFTAWRDEAFDEIQTKYPQYKTNPKLLERFVDEYQDRIPDLMYAKRKNVPVTKAFFMERLMRVHRAITDPTAQAKEDGKKEALKTISDATFMSAGSQGGQRINTPAPTAKRPLFQKPSSSLSDWITEK